MHTTAVAVTAALLAVVAIQGCGKDARGESATGDGATIAEGQQIFRHETFGNEKFWTDTAKLHEVIQSSVSPNAALKAGLKVDASVIPPDVAAAIKAGKVDLNSPATTVT